MNASDYKNEIKAKKRKEKKKKQRQAIDLIVNRKL
jgi:hypothetical protein